MSKATAWDVKNMPDMQGSTVLITGGASGIGYEAALAMLQRGAEVTIAVRDTTRGEQALVRLRQAVPRGQVSMRRLDLADLDSVRTFAADWLQENRPLTHLINNAGVMVPPYRKTKDGFELQFGTNHLGHFALTGLLLPALQATTGAEGARIVTVSSLAARSGKLDFNNLDGSKGYKRFPFYCQSKLANLLFAVKLQHKLAAAGSSIRSIACHPGVSDTNLFSRGSGKEINRFMKFMSSLVTQPAAMGALPTLYAATVPTIAGGELIGPDGPGGRKGYPIVVPWGVTLYNEQAAEQLWTVSERLTGVHYSL